MFRKRLVIGYTLLMLVATVVITRFPLYLMPRIVRRVYLSEKMHIVAHLCLYAVLAWLIASALWRRVGRRGLPALLNWRLFALLTLILVVALIHETVQLYARGLTTFRTHEVFDVGVDLVGALAGLVSYHAVRSWVMARRGPAQSPPYSAR